MRPTAFVFAVAMTAALGGVSCAPAVKRVDVPMGRTIAVVTQENPTPYFRWPLRIRYLGDGSEWTPRSCGQAVEEVRAMVPREFLSALREVVSASAVDASADVRADERMSVLKDRVDAALGARFPGEDGFLDAVSDKLRRSWAGSGRFDVEAGCRAALGDVDPFWFALIVRAATG